MLTEKVNLNIRCILNRKRREFIENIKPVDKPFKVLVYSCRENRAYSQDMIGEATVVGAYERPYWHPYTYSAYHVIYGDGKKATVYADHCKSLN
ncbi:hypothetical protein [Bacillus atrophaeus]|uniref:hypothetical protein n=1 Tax=Bacillus atrophaeus TaxID=1452 RepID=UPI002280F738|nr:hypothetical protein [Bacillus atrophaeus]MCY8907783.1 hypothetical protein [Bacillus atrophaeus]